MHKKIYRHALLCFSLMSLLSLMSVIFLYSQLPEVESLRDIQLQVPLRILTADNKLVAEFGEKRRIPVEIEEVPEKLIQAFLATEDRRFYQHSGVDLRGLLRAGLHLVSHGNKGQGGSTITMQVARNFFLTRKKTYSRKLNEILLAIKIEQELSKDEILSLYLNKVFLGHRAYGIAAAAKVYYGKELNQLSLAQCAVLAGLPKAPSAINPISNPNASMKRRRLVLDGMRELGQISEQAYEEAYNAPVTAKYHGTLVEVKAPYIAEMVRKELLNQFGENAYTQGLQVYTTIDSKLQSYANTALTNGLLAYDQRHGIRKLKTIEDKSTWEKSLKRMTQYGKLRPAIITAVDEDKVQILIKNKGHAEIDWQEMAWARRDLGKLRVSYFPKKPSDVVSIGNVIYTYQLKNGKWRLGQVPEAEGALVSIDPDKGAILSLVGGFDYVRSKFNRVTQAELQPGSNFKPFVYTAALAEGYTPASIINDSPIVFTDPSEEALWRPENDNKEFRGPTMLRTGLIRSRNLVSIRLLQAIGINTAIHYLQHFGFDADKMPRGLSLALGTANVSPLEIARGYGILANGGSKITPYFIDHINDASGNIIWQSAPEQACREQCELLENIAPRAIDSRNAYIMTNMLQDAVKRGTARGLKSLQRSDLSAKTGTTNDQFDAWFSGYNSKIATTVWVGYDNPRSLGEYAASAALPIWRDYMKQALKTIPDELLPPPAGVVAVKIDPENGLLANSSQSDAVFEVFRAEDVPTQRSKRSATTTKTQEQNLIQPEYIF